MKKSKCNKICPNCNVDMIFNGKSKGRQRYKCTKCNHTIMDNPKFTCTKSAKRAIAILLNLLKNDFYNKNDLAEAFNNAKCDENINKIRFNTHYVNKLALLKTNGLSCYNPKLLICADDTNITLYQIPVMQFKEDTAEVTIKINNNRNLMNCNQSETDTYKSYIKRDRFNDSV